MMSEEERYMKQALKQAKKAYDIDEVPIGCVIVQNGKIIARGYNRRNTDKSVLAHAEIAAISKACKKTGDWRLEDPDVCWRHSAGSYTQGSNWSHESKSWMCWFYYKCLTDETV